MFGWDVNATEDKEPGASQAAKDLCTAESKDTCQAGVEGGAAEAFADPESVTVDPSTGDVYVQDYANHRVDEYTATGQFVLTVGREVNETNDKKPGASTAEKNLCTAESADTCKAGIRSTLGSVEHGAFNFAQTCGDLLAVGGPEGLLYVGDAYRVQELKPDGAWVREISLASISGSEPEVDHVEALALDQGRRRCVSLLPPWGEEKPCTSSPAEGRELASFPVGAQRTKQMDRSFSSTRWRWTRRVIWQTWGTEVASSGDCLFCGKPNIWLRYMMQPAALPITGIHGCSREPGIAIQRKATYTRT